MSSSIHCFKSMEYHIGLFLFVLTAQFFYSIGNSYIVGNIQTERGLGLSRPEVPSVNIVLHNTTLVSSMPSFNLNPLVVYICIFGGYDMDTRAV